MTTTSILEAVFAGAAVLVVASTAITILSQVPRMALVSLAAAFGIVAAAGWVVFAFDPGLDRGAAATGLALCSVAELALVVLADALARRRAFENEFEHQVEQAEGRLSALIGAETERRSAELLRHLSRARADATSLLGEEERKLAAERHRLLAEREQQVRAELTEALARAREGVEQRLAAWSADLEQLQLTLKTEAARLSERQTRLVGEVEARIDSDSTRLDAATEEQRAALGKLRTELAEAAEAAAAVAKADLEEHSSERRRALHEVAERLRRRERELTVQIEREEAEAAQRIAATFGDIERREIDKLSRSVARAGERYAEAAEQQFEKAIKVAREDAARRLGRELERASAMFAREADSALAERLSHVGDAGAQRLEKKLGETEDVLIRRRSEILQELERRLAETESDLRRRLESLEADTEAERAVLEARLHELTRRFDEAVASAERRLGTAVRAS